MTVHCDDHAAIAACNACVARAIVAESLQAFRQWEYVIKDRPVGNFTPIQYDTNPEFRDFREHRGGNHVLYMVYMRVNISGILPSESSPMKCSAAVLGRSSTIQLHMSDCSEAPVLKAVRR